MNFCHFWKFTDTLQWCFTTGKHFWATQTTTRTTQTDRTKKKQQYQVGRKWVQMSRVSLVSWKRLRMQSVAELRGCRYPEMMLSSWKTCRRRRRRTLCVGLKLRPRRCGLHQDCCFITALVTNTVHYFKGFSPYNNLPLGPSCCSRQLKQLVSLTHSEAES